MLRFRTSILNYLLRVLRQLLAIAEGSGAAGQLQNVQLATIRSQSTPKEFASTVLWSLPISSLPAGPNLLDDHVIPYNGLATIGDGEKAFFHLLRNREKQRPCNSPVA